MSENKDQEHVETLYYDNNQLKMEVTYHGKELHGPMKGWYENGQPEFCGHWKNNERHGVWEHIDKNGQKIYGYWHEGKKIRFKIEHAHLMEAFLANNNYHAETLQMKYEPE